MKLCFVIAPQNIHWALDRIAHEIGDRFQGESIYCYDLDNIPEADHYFVTHYSLLPQVFKSVQPSKVNCFFTHESVPISAMVDTMNLCHSVICENKVEFDRLLSKGVSRALLHFIPEGSNNTLFRPHQRTGQGILISSACYPRKNPQTVLGVMKAMPKTRFTIVGKDWEKFIEFPENCSYHNSVPYESYPSVYATCDIYLMCATLEGGGPGGLIEAMHSNLMPVTFDTGNAREYIIDGYNGIILPVTSSVNDVVEAIGRAYKLVPQESLPYNDVWQTIRDFTWNNYANQMLDIILERSYFEQNTVSKP